MSYCIMHIAKRHRQDIGGLQKEANREMTQDKYQNKVDFKKSKNNIYLVRSDNWYRDIKAQIDQHKIKRVRKDAVMAITGIYSASPDWFKTSSEADMIAYLEDCMRFHCKYYGPVISAVIHMDETTPHLQICSVPITSDGRLSAKELVGNKKHMTQLQTRFAREIGAMYGLQRGEDRSADARNRHKSEQEYAIECNNATISAQQRAIIQGFRELSDVESQRQDIKKDIDNAYKELQEARTAIQEAYADNAQYKLRELIDDINMTLERIPAPYASAFMDEYDRIIETKEEKRSVMDYLTNEDGR